MNVLADLILYDDNPIGLFYSRGKSLVPSARGKIVLDFTYGLERNRIPKILPYSYKLTFSRVVKGKRSNHTIAKVYYHRNRLVFIKFEDKRAYNFIVRRLESDYESFEDKGIEISKETLSIIKLIKWIAFDGHIYA